MSKSLIGCFFSLISSGAAWVIQHPSDQEIHVGGSARFTVACSEGGSVQWEHNGVAIPGANTLAWEISDVTKAHSGFYRASISYDGFGEYSNDAELKVNLSPSGLLPRQVADLSEFPNSGYPISSGVSFKGKLYYLKNTLEEYQQLWVTDGSLSGDRKYFNLIEGASSDQMSPIWYLTSDDDVMYFTAPHTERSWLWKTNGDSAPVPLKMLDETGNLSLIASTGFYFVDDGLWVTDGTVEGTRRLGDVEPLTGGEFMVEAGGLVYFVARNESTNSLAVTDGTSEGTRIVRDDSGKSFDRPGDFMAFNDRLYFVSLHGFYRTDGTAENSIRLDQIDYRFGQMIGVIGGEFFFYGAEQSTGLVSLLSMDAAEVFTPVDDEELHAGDLVPAKGVEVIGRRFIYNRSYQLYSSDGTLSGTVLLHSETGRTMTPHSGKMFFSARGNGTGIELWVSDGTPANTRMVSDIFSGPEDSMFLGDSNDFICDVGDKVLFRAFDGNRVGLWESDGTDLGTRELLIPQYLETGDSDVRILKGMGGNLYFRHDWPLWSTDGTEGGSHFVSTLSGSSLWEPAVLPGRLFGADMSKGIVWVSDGTSEGIKNLTNGSVFFKHLVASNVNDSVYMLGLKLGKPEIWKTDGTLEGTALVVADSNLEGGYMEDFQIAQDGRFLFFRRSEVNWTRDFFEPWAHNISTGTTYKIADVYSGLDGSDPSGFQKFGTRYWFLGRDASGFHLFSTSGAKNSLLKHKKISEGKVTRREMISAGHGLYFVVNSALWFSDGSTSGTVKLGDFKNMSNLTAVGDQCFFQCDRGLDDKELWVVGSTAASAVRIKVINKLPLNGGLPSINFNGLLYFTADDEQVGREIWTSDGTLEGTRLLCDSYPGTYGAGPRDFIVYQDQLYFTQSDGVHGRELWVLEAGGRILIHSQPRSQVVALGSVADLEIEAHGENLNYQWYAGRSGDTSTPLGTGNSFSLAGVTRSMFYWCRVGNGREVVDSKAVLLRAVTPYQWWLGSYLPQGPDMEPDFLVDRDRDGNSDFFEYGFGGNPLRKDVLKDLDLSVELQGEDVVLVGRFQRRTAGGLDYKIQVSENLREWSGTGPLEEFSPPLDLGNGFEELAYKLETGDGGPLVRYFRVVLTAVE